MTSTRDRRLLNIISYVCYFFTGSLITTLGLMIGPVSKAFSTDPSAIGNIFTWLNVGLFIPIFFAGMLMARVSTKTLLATAAIVTIGMTVVLTALPSVTTFRMMVLFVGGAAGITMAVGSYLVVRINPDPKERSSRLIFTDFFFSFSGVVFLNLLGYLFKFDFSWLVMYFIMSAIAVLLLLLISSVKFPSMTPPVSPADGTHPAGQATREPWGIAVFFVCVASFAFIYAELVFSLWMPGYLADVVKLPVDTVGRYMGFYWSSKAVGMLIAHSIVRHVPVRTFMLICSGVALACMATITNVNDVLIIPIGIILFGLFNSGIYSSLISYGTLQVKLSPPTLTSTILTSSTAGTLVFAPVSSTILAHYGLHWALNSAVIMYGFMVLVIVLAGLSSRAEGLHSKLAPQE
jgi:TsgA-like MFS transporter